MVAPLVAAGIGAGFGALNKLFGGNKPQITTTSIDQNSQDYLKYGRGFAMGRLANGPGAIDPALLAALQGYGGYADAGRMGLAAFTDPSIMAKFQAYGNDAMNPVFDRQRAQLENSWRSRMAGASAFGVRGQMMGPNYSDINNSQLQFGLQNMDNAQKMAAMFANYGQFGVAGQQNLGQYFDTRDQTWASQMGDLYSRLYGGPLSTTTKAPNPNDSGNLFQSMLGGAVTGLSFASPAKAPTPSAAVYSGGWGGYSPAGGAGPDQAWRPGVANPWAGY
jgi:hypothetical protein